MTSPAILPTGALMRSYARSASIFIRNPGGGNAGFFICGAIMLVGGAIAMALVNPEREAKRRSRWLQPLTASM